MSTSQPTALLAVPDDGLADALDPQTLAILERRRRTAVIRRRGWLVRRILLLADVAGLGLAFLVAQLAFPGAAGAAGWLEAVLFVATIPLWVVAAKIYGLYDRDERSTDHSTLDELVRVFHLVTVGVWAIFIALSLLPLLEPRFERTATFWALAIPLVALGRAAGRSYVRGRLTYLQNTLIVGAGDVGQVVARKFLQHPEYGINLIGFVDDTPKELRPGLEQVPMVGRCDETPALVSLLDVERVVVAWTRHSHTRMLELVRSLRQLGVQVDIVPRIFEAIGPSAQIHTVEGMPLLGLPPVKLSPSSRLVKRGIDVVGALVAIVLTAPLMGFIAWRIRRDSPGPVFFRQTRLGMNMREFTMLKFRTMRVDTDDRAHREFIRATMDPAAAPSSNGLYKLAREDAVTRVGRWLRRTSLDELPQIFNVLRGEMSLVGPRPCLLYETEHFAPHHFERFLMPAGITGLWQVTARAHVPFAEALDMDVAYVHGWSLGLDVTLMLQTVRHLVRRRETA